MMHKKNLALVFTTLIGVFAFLSINAPQVSAVTGSDFQAGRIMDDGIFFDGNSIDSNSVQSFLNSKVPNCDTNGTQPYGGTTRAAYGASRGNPAPFTCLKDYRQDTPTKGAESGLCGQYNGGNKSSSQIIVDVGRACGINPKVLIILLEKEQSLITDDWPWAIQYRSATGYGCPDTAPCDAEYYGFFNQVYNGARQFKRYSRDATLFSYRAYRNNYIQYNPNAGCGGSNIFIQNQATAGLYNYTPYQPNPSALANLYGTGDGCGAYGNRNFWRIYSDWFGNVHGLSSAFFGVFQNPDGSGRWYLAVNGAKHYIPSDLYFAWGLDRYPVQNVSQEYFNSFPTYHDLGRLLKDEWQNYFFVDGGKSHYIRDPRYFQIWNLDPNSAVQSTGVSAALSTGGGQWLGRFIKDQGTNSIYVMDGGRKRLVPSNTSLLYQWGYTPDQSTTLGSTYVNSLVDAGSVTQFVSSSGRNFLIDSGRVLYFDNTNVENAYSSGPFTPVNLMTLSMLPIEKGTNFVAGASNPSWFMLEGGKKHYIPNIERAQNWGYTPGRPLTRLSDPLMNSLTDAGTLNNVVQHNVSGGSLLWAVDGKKHYISTQAVADAWMPSGSTIPTYSSQSLDLLPRGDDLTTLVQANGSQFTYTMDNGSKRYLPLPSIVNAWGKPTLGQVSMLSPSIINQIPEASAISVLIQNSGNYYLLVDGTAYPIDPTYASSWRVGPSVPQVSNATLARFSISANQLKANIKVGNNYYMMNDLYAIPVSKHLDAFGLNSSNSVTLPYNYFSTTADASFLVKSTNQNDTRIWFANKGKKILFSNSAQAINYGYLSKGYSPTALSPAVLAGIPDDTSSSSLLVTKPGAGIKLLSFGYALGFPDGNTLTNYISSTNPILELSPSIYDLFDLKKSASLLVRDDANNIYRIDGGNKRLISNQAVIPSMYPGVPISYLESTAIVSIPTGTPIN